jgi:adenylate cyclase
MLGLLRRSLVAKLATTLLVAIAVGFGLWAMLSARLQSKTMQRLNLRAAESVADSIAAGVRSSMLSGNGLAVRQLVDDAQKGLPDVAVHLYSPAGELVYAEKAPPPPPELRPAHVDAAIRAAKIVDAPDGARAIPIFNANRCRPCHHEGETRGVLTIGTRGARVALDGGADGLWALADITRAAFVQIMTAREQDHLDDFFAELVQASPGFVGIAVYDTDSVLSYGSERLAVPKAALVKGLRPGPPFIAEAGSRRLVVTPLPNEPRCRGCHGSASPMRGALVVALDPQAIRAEPTLLEVSTVSLEHVMLSGLGRLVKRFLDEVAATGTVTSLTLYDAEARVYHDVYRRPVPPPSVARALASRHTVLESRLDDAEPRLFYTMPLENETACQRCHGTDRPLRGAIEVTFDLGKEVEERDRLRTVSALLAVLTTASVFLGLYLGLKSMVLNPVSAISTVAEKVGEGRLDVRAPVHSRDEMGRLASRINGMIVGLKHKLELSKFVSEETIRAVEATEASISRSGERRRITVLFSDIRGFTPFAETRQPEKVVEILNQFLQAQADVVHKHGGDIDKFVGDELMARFSGPDMEARATRCAVEIVGAVANTNQSHGVEGHAIHVGVGIHAGEMVIGAVGAEARMDFTVIGDAVNLGARLCSVAGPDQVLISAETRRAFGDLAGIALRPLDPISVKGKKEPVPVFEATQT